ncbi:MAG TPA: VWA domain-containing protein [Methylomirabilota bacterium]|nr:VWA domain-containing protein [Methylomirabilota bacterium]
MGEKQVARPTVGTSAVDTSSRSEIDAFLKSAEVTNPAATRGRLVFALDATMSRQPTWDRAVHLQAEMFEETARIGGLDVQLVYFRGFGECRASRFVRDARALANLMTRIDCRGGRTQIGRVLSHTVSATRESKVAALVYVGDAMEESVDDLAAKAGELGLLGTKAFLFQEGRDPRATEAFREIARLTRGAHVHLDQNAAGTLGRLLRAVATYAAGGLAALEDYGRGDEAARALLTQLR